MVFFNLFNYDYKVFGLYLSLYIFRPSWNSFKVEQDVEKNLKILKQFPDFRRLSIKF